MNRTDFYGSLTLWFVAAIFLQTGSGNAHPLFSVMGFVAFGITFAVPLFLLAGLIDVLIGD